MHYRIAIDCHFSISRLKAELPTSIHVVYQAPEGAMDSLWVMDAVKRGAQFIVSRDYDIEHWAHKEGAHSIWVANKKRTTKQVVAIIKNYFKEKEADDAKEKD